MAGPPLVPAVPPREYLRPALVGGRPAVIVEPLRPGAPMTVVMREQISFWQVACRNLPEAECIKIVRVFTAARTAPPGPSPTPTPAPVILTAGEVVTEAV